MSLPSITLPLPYASDIVHRQNDSAGLADGNYNYTRMNCDGYREIILSAYCYHDDAAGAHNLTWGYEDVGDTTQMWLEETSRAQNVKHWLHSADGDGADPSCWLHPILQHSNSKYVLARGHAIPVDKKLYVEMLVLRWPR